MPQNYEKYQKMLSDISAEYPGSAEAADALSLQLEDEHAAMGEEEIGLEEEPMMPGDVDAMFGEDELY